jgi:hypothetical protein
MERFAIFAFQKSSLLGQAQAKIIGSFALLFWADHPVSEVKVVDLVPADA